MARTTIIFQAMHYDKEAQPADKSVGNERIDTFLNVISISGRDFVVVAVVPTITGCIIIDLVRSQALFGFSFEEHCSELL